MLRLDGQPKGWCDFGWTGPPRRWTYATGPPRPLDVLSGLARRRLRRRIPARRASRYARTAVPTGIAPLQFPQMNAPLNVGFL